MQDFALDLCDSSVYDDQRHNQTTAGQLIIEDGEEFVLGAEIRKRRRKRRMTLIELAVAIDVHESTVSRWERDLSTPSARRLARLERALRLRPGFLAKRYLD